MYFMYYGKTRLGSIKILLSEGLKIKKRNSSWRRWLFISHTRSIRSDRKKKLITSRSKLAMFTCHLLFMQRRHIWRAVCHHVHAIISSLSKREALILLEQEVFGQSEKVVWIVDWRSSNNSQSISQRSVQPWWQLIGQFYMIYKDARRLIVYSFEKPCSYSTSASASNVKNRVHGNTH